ncbi:MAG: hypothetical protein HY288_07785 [Planctomycetia bacterium]|nr:hypothetical protein [Planctomycetia bacterium]
MADMNLTQAEGDALIAMEEHRANEVLLDLSRGRIDLAKVKLQNRGRQVVVLVRLDLGGAPHRNPDDEEVACPHLHLYRDGYGDKWAVPAPADRFPNPSDLWATLGHFMAYCNITRPPHIERGLFT